MAIVERGKTRKGGGGISWEKEKKAAKGNNVKLGERRGSEKG